MTRRMLLSGVLALAGVWPVAAAGATPPRVPRELTAAPSDPRVLALASQLAPAVRIFNALAVDLDRDGDLDVVATSSEATVVVWLNDGRDRFVRRQPAGSQMVNGGSRLDDRDPAWPALSVLPRSKDVAVAAILPALADASHAGHHPPPARGVRPCDRLASAGRGPPPSRIS